MHATSRLENGIAAGLEVIDIAQPRMLGLQSRSERPATGPCAPPTAGPAGPRLRRTGGRRRSRSGSGVALGESGLQCSKIGRAVTVERHDFAVHDAIRKFLGLPRRWSQTSPSNPVLYGYAAQRRHPLPGVAGDSRRTSLHAPSRLPTARAPRAWRAAARRSAASRRSCGLSSPASARCSSSFLPLAVMNGVRRLAGAERDLFQRFGPRQSTSDPPESHRRRLSCAAASRCLISSQLIRLRRPCWPCGPSACAPAPSFLRAGYRPSVNLRSPRVSAIVRITFGKPIAAIPKLDGAAAILSLGDRASKSP